MMEVVQHFLDDVEGVAFRTLDELQDEYVVFDNEDDAVMGCPVQTILVEDVVLSESSEEFL